MPFLLHAEGRNDILANRILLYTRSDRDVLAYVLISAAYRATVLYRSTVEVIDHRSVHAFRRMKKAFFYGTQQWGVVFSIQITTLLGTLSA